MCQGDAGAIECRLSCRGAPNNRSTEVMERVKELQNSDTFLAAENVLLHIGPQCVPYHSVKGATLL